MNVTPFTYTHRRPSEQQARLQRLQGQEGGAPQRLVRLLHLRAGGGSLIWGLGAWGFAEIEIVRVGGCVPVRPEGRRQAAALCTPATGTGTGTGTSRTQCGHKHLVALPGPGKHPSLRPTRPGHALTPTSPPLQT